MSDKCTPVNISDYFKTPVVNPQGTPEGEKGEASPPSGSDIPPYSDSFFKQKEVTNSSSLLAAEKAFIPSVIELINSGIDSANAVKSVIEGLVNNPLVQGNPELLKIFQEFERDLAELEKLNSLEKIGLVMGDYGPNLLGEIDIKDKEKLEKALQNLSLPLLQGVLRFFQNSGIENIEQIRQLKEIYKASGLETVLNKVIELDRTIATIASNNFDSREVINQVARAVRTYFPGNSVVSGVTRGLLYLQKGASALKEADDVATELLGAAEALVQAGQEAIFAACQALKVTSLLISKSNLIWSALQQLAGAVIGNFVNNLQIIWKKLLGIQVPQSSSWIRLQSFSGVNWGIDIGQTFEKCIGLFTQSANPVVANEVLNKIGEVKNKVQQANRGIGTFQRAIMGNPGTNPIKNTWASAKSMVSIGPNPAHILSQDIPSLSAIVIPTVTPSNMQGVSTTGLTSLPDQALTRPVVSPNGTIVQAIPSGLSTIENNIKLGGDADKLAKLSNELGLSMTEFADKLKQAAKIYSEEEILEYAKEFVKAAKKIALNQNMALVPSNSGESEVELILIAKEYFDCLYKNRPVFRPPGSPDPNETKVPKTSTDDNLVLYLAFNEEPGTTSFKDSSRYSHEIMPVNNGEGLSLEGGADNNALRIKKYGGVSVEGQSTLKLNLTEDPASDFTIEFWLNPSELNEYNFFVGSKQIFANSIALRLNSVGVLQIVMFANGAWRTLVETTSPLIKNQWNKVEIVRKDRKLFIFLKGKQVALSDFNFLVNYSTNGLLIGNHPDIQSYQRFNGLIDEFKIFNIAKYTQEHPVPDTPPAGTDTETSDSESNNNNTGGNNEAGGGNSNTPINVVTSPPIESDLDPRVTDNPAEVEEQKINEALSGAGTLPFSATSVASNNQSNSGLSATDLANNPLLGLPLGFMTPAQQNIVNSFTDPDAFPSVSEFSEEFLKDDETGELFSSKYNRLLYVVIALLCRTTTEWEEFKKFKGLDTKILKIKSEPLTAQAHESLYSKTVLQGYGGNSPFIWFAQGARTLKTDTMAEILLLFLQHRATEQQVVPVYNWLKTNETIDFSVPLAFELNVPEKEAATDSFDYVNTHRQSFASIFTSLRDSADMIGGPLGFEYVVVLAIMLLMTRIEKMIEAKKPQKEVAQVADIAIELTKYLSAKSSILLDLRMLRGF